MSTMLYSIIILSKYLQNGVFFNRKTLIMSKHAQYIKKNLNKPLVRLIFGTHRTVYSDLNILLIQK